MSLSCTHTYVLLEVSPETYKEIKDKLEHVGYHHVINEDGEIDLHGIALVEGEPNGKKIRTASTSS